MGANMEINELAKMKSVLIINISHIGDFVCGMVLIDYLRKNNYQVDVLKSNTFNDLLDQEPLINSINEEDVKEKSYNFLVDLTSSKKSAKIAEKIKSRIKIFRYKTIFQKIFYRPIYNVFIHESIYHNITKDFYPIMEYFGYIGKRENLLPCLNVKKSELIQDLPKDKIKVGIHIGTQNLKRDIPINLILSIIQYLKEKNIIVILLGTDENTILDIINKCDNYPIYKKGSIGQIKDLISKLDFFIGPDSGLLHIASAVNTKAIAIFGPTLSKVCAPLDFTSIVEQNLVCRPCNQGKKCLYDNKCFSSISFNQIKICIDNIINSFTLK